MEHRILVCSSPTCCRRLEISAPGSMIAPLLRAMGWRPNPERDGRPMCKRCVSDA